MQEDSRDANGIPMVAASDEVVRRYHRGTARPGVFRTGEAIQRAAGLVRQPSPDDGAGAGVDEIPIVDETQSSHVQREDASAQRFIGGTVELVYEDHKGEQSFFVDRRSQQAVDVRKQQVGESSRDSANHRNTDA